VHIDSLEQWLRDGLLPATLIVIGSVLIARAIRSIVGAYGRALDTQARDAEQGDMIVPDSIKRSRAVTQAISWGAVSCVYFVAGLLALRELGVPITTLIAPATALGVALGVGAQQVVGDVLAGFFLFSEHQFGVGDLICLSTPGAAEGVTGIVEEMTLRATKLRTASGELVTLPNGALRQVTNLSKDWSQVVLDIPVPTGADLEKASDALREAASSMAHDPKWSGVLLGDAVVRGAETIDVDHVRLRLVVRTLPGRQLDVSRELRLRCARALNEADVAASKSKDAVSAR
jgi:small conductance mechanosensitive channel